MNQSDKNPIYLAGGGDEHQTFLFDEVYLKNLPQGGKLLYIPVALRGHKLYKSAPTWLRNLIDLHHRQDVEMETWTDLNNRKVSELENFDTIFIGGGNTWSLLKEIRESGFDKLLLEFITNSGSIYGGSAGAIILSKKITSPDKNEVNWKDDSGLDLLGGYSVACHYNSNDGEEYAKWAPIICLPEETGAIVDSNIIKIIGDKPGLQIASETRKILENGNFIDL